MKQKGMTLIETMLSLVIISIFLLSINSYTGMIEKIQFNNLLEDIESSIRMAQQSAWLQRSVYTIEHSENCIYIRDTHKIQHKIPIPEHIEVMIGNKEADSNKQHDLRFSRGLAPSVAGTITIKDHKSFQLVQITVRPATGKVAKYISQYEKD